MGPILIFDKSTLESLNPDEAMWLDQFYSSNVTPLFYVETLADLEKNLRGGRTPESVVGNLAYKTPDMNSNSNAHHLSLLLGELLRGDVLNLKLGRPHISGGRSVQLEGRQGVIFEQSAEEEALSRWQQGEFLDLERQFARRWRAALSHLDFELQYQRFQKFFPLGKPGTFQDVRRFVDFYLDGPNQEIVLRFGLSLIGISPQDQTEVLQRWNAQGKPAIRAFAPYFAHVFAVDLFFYLALAADVVSRDRPSHKIDLAYLYYLPFCMVFTSNDKFHANIVPLFLRDDQSFVLGTRFKEDLAGLDMHYSALPEAVKERGVMSFALSPPKDSSFLTTQLWDKHMASTWRERGRELSQRASQEITEKLKDEMRRLEDAPTVAPGGEVSSDEAVSVAFRRVIHGRKGKWLRLPPGVVN